MNAVMPVTSSPVWKPGRWTWLWLAMIAVTALLMFAREALPWAFEYPRGWELPLAKWISAFETR